MDITMLKSGSVQALMEMVRRMFLEINTSIPGEIVFFNPVLQTATIKPCVRSVTINQEGEKRTIDLPEILMCPVWFPYGNSSGFSMTYPVNPKDQCLIIFSQRSFDNWLIHGSIQDPAEKDRPRSHSYNDAIALVGLIPAPSAIPLFQSDGIEMRNKGRTSYHKVSDLSQERLVFKDETGCQETLTAAGTISRIASASISSTSPLHKFEGDMQLDGSLQAIGVTHKLVGASQLIGTIETAETVEDALQQGVTADVQIPSGPLLKFVNGLLVQIS